MMFLALHYWLRGDMDKKRCKNCTGREVQVMDVDYMAACGEVRVCHWAAQSEARENDHATGRHPSSSSPPPSFSPSSCSSLSSLLTFFSSRQDMVTEKTIS